MKHVYFPYVLSLQAPVIFSNSDGDPNHVSTLRYVPGTAVRGAVARFLEQNAPERVDELVLSGAVSYLNAYPSVNGRRALPMPVAFVQEKHQERRHDMPLILHNLAAYEGDQWPDGQFERAGAEFITLDYADRVLVEPKVSSQFHQQRDRQKGRPWEEKGAIFSYESLDAGQDFSGFFLITGDTDVEIESRFTSVKAALRSPLLLGRSRRGEYGGNATVNFKEPVASELNSSSGFLIKQKIEKDAQFQIFLTSPYIGRDSMTGQVDPLALSGEIITRLEKKATFVHARWSFCLVGGSNRKWGTKLPQYLAASAGSILTFQATEDLELDRIRAVEDSGIGERRTEGFGRVAFVRIAYEQLNTDHLQEKPSTKPGAAVPPLVSAIEQRILDDRIESSITAAVERIVVGVRGTPSNSLIGRLRTPFRSQSAEALTTLKNWLNSEHSDSLRKSAMRQLENCHLNGQSLNAFLGTVVDDNMNAPKSELVKLLRLDVVAQRGHISSEQNAFSYLASESDILKCRLIDELLATLVRANRQDKE